ncbi:MAG TPA: hypothetical protein VNK26_02185 [Pyrinomonadaceae bacterium]|nr:hypothetical protein [Pyrinomonadaceae bacterium]
MKIKTGRQNSFYLITMFGVYLGLAVIGSAMPSALAASNSQNGHRSTLNASLQPDADSSIIRLFTKLAAEDTKSLILAENSPHTESALFPRLSLKKFLGIFAETVSIFSSGLESVNSRIDTSAFGICTDLCSAATDSFRNSQLRFNIPTKAFTFLQRPNSLLSMAFGGFLEVTTLRFARASI